MIRRSRLMTLAAGSAISFIFAHALADVPAAMDRVPSDAAIIISVKNIGQLKSSMESLAKSIGVPAEKMAGMSKMGEVLNMPGADASGSAAIGVLNVSDEDGDKSTIAVIPVKDYAAFVKNFGGKGTGVDELKIEDKPVYAKSLDSGFAAVGASKELVESFGGKTGNGKAHEAAMGATGKAIAESDDLVFIANISKLGDKIKEGTQNFKEQMGAPLAMAGGGDVDLSGIDKLMEGFTRDGSVGVVGLKISDAGVTLDLGAQFKEGSEFAGYLAAKGKASSLISSLPNQPFLFAIAMDTSDPKLREAFKNIKEGAAKMKKKDDGPGLFPTWTEGSDGMAVQIGSTPAPMGGLFINTVAVVKSSKPADLAKQMKDGLTAMNGKTSGGVKFTTNYEAGVKAGSGTADAWSVKMAADENDPNSGMVTQISQVLFGPLGLNGYAVTTENGLVLTYSKNPSLLDQTVTATKGGASMAADTEVSKIASGLPADRTFEGYLGTKSLLDTALGMMAMFGAGPGNFNAPDDVPPVGLAATTNGGGIRLSIVVPTKVITTLKALGDAMNQGEGGDDKMQPGDPKAGQPKF